MYIGVENDTCGFLEEQYDFKDTQFEAQSAKKRQLTD